MKILYLPHPISIDGPMVFTLFLPKSMNCYARKRGTRQRTKLEKRIKEARSNYAKEENFKLG